MTWESITAKMVKNNHLHCIKKGDNKMKKTIENIRNILICAVIAVIMVGCFLGAALQESYKLEPLTAAEVNNG